MHDPRPDAPRPSRPRPGGAKGLRPADHRDRARLRARGRLPRGDRAASPAASTVRSRSRSPRGVAREDPLERTGDILVPITGTEVSRRGAEVALALARASGTPVMALYVRAPRPGRPRGRRYGGPRGRSEERPQAHRRAGRPNGVPLRTALRVDVAAEERDPAPGPDRRLRPDRDGRHAPAGATRCSSATSPTPCSRPRTGRSCSSRAELGGTGPQPPRPVPHRAGREPMVEEGVEPGARRADRA